MSFTPSFSNALSGLTATRRLADIASNNLANALTDGFARKSVELGSAVLDGTGVGISVRDVTRAADPNLTASRRQADGEAATFEAQAEALSRLGRVFGEATADDGLFRRVESFEEALRLFAETPESEPRQVQAVEAAKDLVAYLNRLSEEARFVRQEADQTIAAQVETVNSNVERIDRIDANIVRLRASGQDVTGLIDERERLIDEVAAIIPVRVHAQSNGSVHLTTTQGLYLLGERPVPLEFTPRPTITAAMRYDPSGAGALSGLTLNGIDIAPDSTHPQRLVEGALAGNFIVRDGVGVEFINRIDQFSADLIARFEDPAVDPTLTAGTAGLFTDNGAPLDPLQVEGLAGRISLNVLVDQDAGGEPRRLRDGLQSTAPGPAGSDTIPRALLDALRSARPAGSIPGVSGNMSAFQMVTAIADATGTARVRAEDTYAALLGTRETLALAESERIGVDTDLELQSLIQIEQAFSANLQVIQTASRMLEELTEIR